MKVNYKGFTIEILSQDGEFEVSVKRLDNSLIDHEDNPDYYMEEEDALAHGKYIIDEFLKY